jgi:hypothetical protein
MATSGNSAYASSTLDIITESLEILGVLGEGESATTAQVTSMKRTLNNLCKAWQADGLNIFAVQPLYLFLDGNSMEYDLYLGSSNANFTTSYVVDVLTAATASGGNSAVVADSSGFTIGGRIAISLPSSTTHFANVTNVAANLVTFSPVLPEDTAIGGLVYGYTTQGSQPMQVMNAWLRRHTSESSYNDSPVNLISRQEYAEFAVKNTVGSTTQLQVEPQRTTTKLRAWPVGNGSNEILGMYVQRRLDTFISNTDEPDYPQEWFLALTYNLAMASLPKYGNPSSDFNRISSLATLYYEQARGFDKELYTTVQVQPRFY